MNASNRKLIPIRNFKKSCESLKRQQNPIVAVVKRRTLDPSSLRKPSVKYSSQLR